MEYNRVSSKLVDEIQQTLEEFLKEWPIERVFNMTLEEYADNEVGDSFCYSLENKYDGLGSIKGTIATKFGIYKRKKEALRSEQYEHDSKYTWSRKLGKNAEEAFESVKYSITQTIMLAETGRFHEIDKIQLHQFVKWKIAFIYSRANTINIYTRKALEFIFDLLGRPFTRKTPISVFYKVILDEKPSEISNIEWGIILWARYASYKAIFKESGGKVPPIPPIETPVAEDSYEEFRKDIIIEDEEDETDIIPVYIQDYIDFNDEELILEDQLEIEDDVKAFARLIASKNTEGNLAIGLFGNWGSGKTFFMRLLKSQINQLALYGGDDYKKNFVHVPFNAWHYSDSNIWAAMLVELFNRLNDVTEFGSNYTDKLYKNLKSTKKLEQHIDKKLESKSRYKNDLLQAYKKVKEEQKFKWKDLYAQNESNLKELSNIISEDLKENGVFDVETEGIAINIVKKDGFFPRLFKAMNFFRKTNPKRFYISISSYALIFVGLLIGGNYAIEHIPELNAEGPLYNVISSIISFFTPIVLYIKSLGKYKRQINKYLGWINDINIDIKSKEEKAIEENLVEVNKEIGELKKTQIEIENGEHLIKYIYKTATGDGYTKHLGIIRKIKADIETLESQIDILNKSNSNQNFKIDRIVLYIDDLDRCSTAKVVEVLEAVHLIFTSKLFVVVVGVDSRWIASSLNKEYSVLRETSTNEKVTITRSATSYDYLEKIFQIPFAINPIEDKIRKNFVRNLLNKQIEEDTQTDSTQVIKTTDDITGTVIDSTSEEDSGKIDEKSIVEFSEVKIDKKELDYITEISQIIGDTPRTIKRFINIYRLIRSHNSFKKVKIENGEYKEIVILLAIFIANSTITTYIKKEFTNSQNVNKNVKEVILSMNEKLSNNREYVNLKRFIERNKQFKSELEKLDIKDLKEKFEFISRFTFRACEEVVLENNNVS